MDFFPLVLLEIISQPFFLGFWGVALTFALFGVASRLVRWGR